MGAVEGLRDVEVGDLIKFARNIGRDQGVYWLRVRGFSENGCPLVSNGYLSYLPVNWDEITEVIKPGEPDDDLIFGGCGVRP